MNVSRRNMLYTLGSLGMTAALPALTGCRNHPKPSSPNSPSGTPPQTGNPNEVRVLLEGPWILTAASNAATSMQAIHSLAGGHVCHFGFWSDCGMTDVNGKSGDNPISTARAWSVDPSTKSPNSFQNVVAAAGKAHSIVVNETGHPYSVLPDKADFMVTLPIPDCIDFGLAYLTTYVQYGNTNPFPHIAAVLHYKVPQGGGPVVFHTGSDFSDLNLLAGKDVVLRMMHPVGKTTTIAKDRMHVKSVFDANVKRIVDRNNKHPAMQLILKTLDVDSTQIGNISEDELGGASAAGSQSCSAVTGKNLTNTTLANCMGGHFVVGDGN